jgi:ATP-dependent DNA ligase
MKEYLEIEPGRAKAKNERVVDELMDDPEWVAEEKLDGWRFLVHFGGELERAFMTGRRTSEITGRLSEKGLCAECLWPAWEDVGYTVIDGEVMPPIGAGFRDLAGIMNVTPEQALVRIGEIGEPHYYAFDLLYLNGQDVRSRPYLERKHLLTKLVPELGNGRIHLLEHREDKRVAFKDIIGSGGEGVCAEYGEGWVKVKRETTLDVIVTGFTEAKFGVTGKFHGQVGAAKVAVYSSRGTLIEVAQVSGMDDATRLDMTNNPGRWLGTVLEISAYKWAKDRLQHPRFKRHKPEADPKHATLVKLMQDLGETLGDKEEKQCSLF